MRHPKLCAPQAAVAALSTVLAHMPLLLYPLYVMAALVCVRCGFMQCCQANCQSADSTKPVAGTACDMQQPCHVSRVTLDLSATQVEGTPDQTWGDRAVTSYSDHIS